MKFEEFGNNYFLWDSTLTPPEWQVHHLAVLYTLRVIRERCALNLLLQYSVWLVCLIVSEQLKHLKFAFSGTEK